MENFHPEPRRPFFTPLLIEKARVGWRRASDFLFPPTCPGCGRVMAEHGALCQSCWRDVSFIERPYCDVLGTPFEHDLGAGFLSAEAIANPPVFDRLRARYEDEGVDVAVYLSVRALQPSSALDFDQRVQAVQAFRKLPEAAALAAANKRVSNLLSKAEGSVPGSVDSALLQETAEQALAKAVADAEQALANAGSYRETLERLASLREPVDSFFETVLVNAENAAVRGNRYALLAKLRGLFLGVADISVLG